MFRNMVVSLFEHQRITTTLAKAKELRGWAEKLITLGKKNSLHARRLAFALLRNEGIVKKLFEEIAPQYKDRQGGYTRIYKMGWRQGDRAPLSLIELVTLAAAPEKKKKSAVTKARGLGKSGPQEEGERGGKRKSSRPEEGEERKAGRQKTNREEGKGKAFGGKKRVDWLESYREVTKMPCRKKNRQGIFYVIQSLLRWTTGG
jgi:large subunit ribosomal protein L17